jgi:hypothetical protein
VPKWGYLNPTDVIIPVRHIIVVLALCAAAVLTASAEIIKSGSFQASSDGANITVRWITEDESGIAYYELQRRSTTDGLFATVTTVDAKGASLYEYIDYSAFLKTTTLYQYQVVAHFTDAGRAPMTYGPITVTHTVSAVRRTWGSIKSMFR